MFFGCSVSLSSIQIKYQFVAEFGPLVIEPVLNLFRLLSGDLPDDFLKVTEPTASVTTFSEKPKQKTADDDGESATLLSRHANQVAASQSGQLVLKIFR